MFIESKVLIFLLGFVVGALVAPVAILIYLAIWDTKTGEPLHNAIAWPDTRTKGLVRELKEQERQRAAETRPRHGAEAQLVVMLLPRRRGAKEKTA